jgi:hypothetical protein
VEEGRIAMNRRDGGIPSVSEKDGRSRARERAAEQHGKKKEKRRGRARGKERVKHGELKNTGRKRIEERKME